MHRPDAAAHRDGAGAGPGEAAAPRPGGDQAIRDRQRDIGGADGDGERQRDQNYVVAGGKRALWINCLQIRQEKLVQPWNQMMSVPNRKLLVDRRTYRTLVSSV